MRLRFLFAFPFLFTFTSSNFLESATIGNRTILVGFFSVKTTDLSSLKIGDKEWAQLKEMLLPVDFFQQIADNSPPCDPHDPNCKSCDPHDPNCKSSGNPGGHGGGEIEAWMKRMLCKCLTDKN